jgi:hypothetical protein
MSARLAAWLFGALLLVLALFQLALAAGAPWGAYAMGGAFPGVFPPAMRVAALVQVPILALVALVVFARAGLVLPGWARAARILIWIVVALLAVGVVLNLITPSPMERLIWAPVAIVLFLTSLRVALAR